MILEIYHRYFVLSKHFPKVATACSRRLRRAPRKPPDAPYDHWCCCAQRTISGSMRRLQRGDLRGDFAGTHQTAQQLGLTHTTARGFRTWQLSEKHRLALERQAEEHHRPQATASKHRYPVRQLDYVYVYVPERVQRLYNSHHDIHNHHRRHHHNVCN